LRGHAILNSAHFLLARNISKSVINVPFVKYRSLLALFPLLAIVSNAHAQSTEAGRVTVTASPAPTHENQITSEASGTETTNTKPGFAPLSVMTGCAGDWMISYQFMFDSMDGNLVGTDKISTREILRSFAFAPKSMTMEMHMFTGMYAFTDRFNLTVMLPYLVKDMDMRPREGNGFTEHSNGIGDLELLATYTVWQTSDLRHRILIKGGNGIPTGSIDAKMDGFPLEYCMQLGSGTVSLLPGLTYLGQAPPWGWGFNFDSIIQLGTNDHHYRFGNRYQPSVWVARDAVDWLTVSLSAKGEIWENVHGADPRLNPSDQQTNDPNRQGGKRLDAALSITVHPRFLRGHQFLFEGEFPVAQSLNGPQLQRSWLFHCGWQWDF
jgi:hypothetical protein